MAKMKEGDDVVLYEVRDGVALITWNRPDRSNAWSPALERRYFDLLRLADQSSDVRAIVVTGAGRNFCPGMDTRLLADTSNGSRANDPEAREPQTVPTTILKPIISAIHGACAGTGLIQACMTDVRFADSDSRITAAFPRRGIMTEHGLAVLLPALIGWASAVDVLLSGRVISGVEASELGLVKLSDPGAALSDALAYARDLADNCSPQAMAVTKQQLWKELRRPLEESRLEALTLWRTLREHGDFKEGIASFVERRSPAFQAVGGADLQRIKEMWAAVAESVAYPDSERGANVPSRDS